MPRLYVLKLLSVVVLATGSICPISLAASDSAESSICSAPLSVDEVVDNLVRRNQQREQSLQSTEATRVYHLEYRGFPSDREAQMTVHAVYSRPSFKSFAVISQNGSKLILDRVFKKLLESEKEAASAEMHDRTLLNRTNYDFALIRCEPASAQYVLQVTPKSKSKYVYHGQVWVDGADFAVTRIEAEPAQNPSFWTKRSQIHHEYEKIQGFWVPARNESISYIRLGGRATLTIEYSDYHVKGPAEPPAVSSAAGVK